MKNSRVSTILSERQRIIKTVIIIKNRNVKIKKTGLQRAQNTRFAFLCKQSTFLILKNVDCYLCKSAKTLRVYFALTANQFFFNLIYANGDDVQSALLGASASESKYKCPAAADWISSQWK